MSECREGEVGRNWQVVVGHRFRDEWLQEQFTVGVVGVYKQIPASADVEVESCRIPDEPGEVVAARTGQIHRA